METTPGAHRREGFETLGPGARVSLDFWWKMKRAGGRSEGSRKTRSFFTAGPAVPAAQPVTISGLSVAGVQTFYPEVPPRSDPCPLASPRKRPDEAGFRLSMSGI